MCGFRIGDLVRLADPPDEVFVISAIDHDNPRTYELTNQRGDAVLGRFKEGDMTAVSLWNEDYHVRCRVCVLELISALVKYLSTGCTGDIGWFIWI